MTAPFTAGRPWGALVAVYFVIIGLPSGLGLVTWGLGRLGGPGTRLRRYTDPLSAATLVAISVLLVTDLGRPERFFLMLTRFDNLGSPIAVGAKLIALKLALLVVAIWAVERYRRLNTAAARGYERGGTGAVRTGTLTIESPASRRSARDAAATGTSGPPGPEVGTAAGAALMPIVGWGLLATSFALALYPAAVLSRTWSSPLAATSGAGLLFLLTSLLLGAAAIGLLAATAPARLGLSGLLRPVRRLLLGLLGAYAITLVFEALSLIGDPRHSRTVAELSTGAQALLWWLAVVAVGLVVPAAVLAIERRRAFVAGAAVAVVVGACAARFLLFSVGG
ncbi:NrfD/PsrC family molybdoenzyme membrane anchor subunit [Micromonospora sp. NPDC000442]|uniref:NrfD/PsrC family molybdoenzyme membrane anchor subunit n=1 Tax=Micromonospora sp. NPDC000442 TaxID=3364217 RepID=UPI00367BC7A5